VMFESSLCAKHKSSWEGFGIYELATFLKLLKERKSLLISEFTVEEGYQCKEIRHRIMNALSLEKCH
jgi:hypothetical protein